MMEVFHISCIVFLQILLISITVADEDNFGLGFQNISITTNTKSSDASTSTASIFNPTSVIDTIGIQPPTSPTAVEPSSESNNYLTIIIAVIGSIMAVCIIILALLLVLCQMYIRGYIISTRVRAEPSLESGILHEEIKSGDTKQLEGLPGFSLPTATKLDKLVVNRLGESSAPIKETNVQEKQNSLVPTHPLSASILTHKTSSYPATASTSQPIITPLESSSSLPIVHVAATHPPLQKSLSQLSFLTNTTLPSLVAILPLANLQQLPKLETFPPLATLPKSLPPLATLPTLPTLPISLPPLATLSILPTLPISPQSLVTLQTSPAGSVSPQSSLSRPLSKGNIEGELGAQEGASTIDNEEAYFLPPLKDSGSQRSGILSATAPSVQYKKPLSQEQPTGTLGSVSLGSKVKFEIRFKKSKLPFLYKRKIKVAQRMPRKIQVLEHAQEDVTDEEDIAPLPVLLILLPWLKGPRKYRTAQFKRKLRHIRHRYSLPKLSVVECELGPPLRKTSVTSTTIKASSEPIVRVGEECGRVMVNVVSVGDAGLNADVGMEAARDALVIVEGDGKVRSDSEKEAISSNRIAELEMVMNVLDSEGATLDDENKESSKVDIVELEREHQVSSKLPLVRVEAVNGIENLSTLERGSMLMLEVPQTSSSLMKMELKERLDKGLAEFVQKNMYDGKKKRPRLKDEEYDDETSSNKEVLLDEGTDENPSLECITQVCSDDLEKGNGVEWTSRHPSTNRRAIDTRLSMKRQWTKTDVFIANPKESEIGDRRGRGTKKKTLMKQMSLEKIPMETKIGGQNRSIRNERESSLDGPEDIFPYTEALAEVNQHEKFSLPIHMNSIRHSIPSIVHKWVQGIRKKNEFSSDSVVKAMAKDGMELVSIKSRIEGSKAEEKQLQNEF